MNRRKKKKPAKPKSPAAILPVNNEVPPLEVAISQPKTLAAVEVPPAPAAPRLTSRKALPDKKAPPNQSETNPIPFASVLEAELKLIVKRRHKIDGQSDPDPEKVVGDDDDDLRMMKLRVQALKLNTTGLTFSGGGIRAGTFAVGILQGLASLGLVKRFDYLSTVSGGGYAGGWLAAWLKREGDVANVEKQLSLNRVTQSTADRLYLQRQVVDEEPQPLRHLRAYSSYMTPQPGLLTADTWTILMIWSRNILINLLLLLPLSMLVVLIARSILYIYRGLNQPQSVASGDQTSLGLGLFGVGCLLFLAAFIFNARVLREFRGGLTARRSWGARVAGSMRSFIINPILVATILVTIGVRGVIWQLGSGLKMDDLSTDPNKLSFWSELLLLIKSTLSDSGRDLAEFPDQVWAVVTHHPGYLEFPNVLLHLGFFGVLLAIVSAVNAASLRPFSWVRLGRYVLASFAAGAIGGALFPLVEALLSNLARAGVDQPDLMATFAPPLTLMFIVVSVMVEVALMGRAIEEAEREWWARFSALNTITALVWMFGMATILYVPYLILYGPSTLKYALVSGWIGSGSFSLIAGRFLLPRLKGGGGGGLSLTTIAAAASVVFLVGLMGLVATLVGLVVNGKADADLANFPSYLSAIKGASAGMIAILTAACAIAVLLARWLIDVNLFSINSMYANRLIRCYLGASRAQTDWHARWNEKPRNSSINSGATSLSGDKVKDIHGLDDENDPVIARNPNPVTGFDPKDDFDLIDLLIGEKTNLGDREYWGPHLLLNTTLNLVGGSDLAWRDRKGESFTLSPLYCGSKGTGYAKMTRDSRRKITLGRAISISGAAIDPNMAFYQSSSLTALLTVFNARLGYWLERPKPQGWKANSPRFGDHILDEFLGETNSKSEYVHITDGGHFENLGVYELIRRRCRFIVVIDSGEDGQGADDNMSIMIRLCRIDFGVRINLDTRPLEMEGVDNLTKTHVVIGRIHYDDVDQGEMPGVMVYIKVSLTGDEPPDLLKYAKKEPAFPHQSTDFRQSFDEEQFECYRCLGDHIAREVFGDSVERLRAVKLDGKTAHKDFVPALFSVVQGRWTETIDNTNDRLMDLERAWGDLHGEFRKSPALAHLSRDLYPELLAPSVVTPPDVRERAELHAVIQMVELMSSAWLALNLRNFHDLPGKRGWLNTFRRFVSTSAFQKYWPLVRSEFDSNFVRFCETELHLGITLPNPILVPWPTTTAFDAQAVQLLEMEFAREWPDEVLKQRSLTDLIKRAVELKKRLGLSNPPIWLIVQAPLEANLSGVLPNTSVVGIILAATFPDIPAKAMSNFAGTMPVELFTWVRRPYRAVGMGSRSVRKILKQQLQPMLEIPPGPFKEPLLWVRYPKRSVGGDSDLEGGIWLNFFARFDFRKVVPREENAWDGTLLVREPLPGG